MNATPEATTIPAPSVSDRPALNGAGVLDDIAAFFRRFVVFPSPHDFTAVTLWAAHTHVVDGFYVTPRLVLDSPEPGSGKTRVLEILELFCRNPEMVLSPTTAAIFRMIAERPISLLFDETDAIFNAKNAGNHEDLRALLNSGYKIGATIPRCVGDAKAMKVHRFTVFSPVALGGLAGNMPQTILTRAVTIHMRKRAPHEHVDPFSSRDAEIEAMPIRDRLATWITALADDLGNARPTMPEGVSDRPAEVWEALLAVADAAGGDWPEAARDACRHFVLDANPHTRQSFGTRLLADLRTLYGDADRMTTADIIEHLTALDDAPWGDLWGGKPLDARRLSAELSRYGVSPTTIRPEGGIPAKGYTTSATRDSVGLTDAWQRYLPPPRPTDLE